MVVLEGHLSESYKEVLHLDVLKQLVDQHQIHVEHPMTFHSNDRRKISHDFIDVSGTVVPFRDKVKLGLIGVMVSA